MGSRRLAFAALLAALASNACITGGYYRTQTNEPVAHELIRALEPGRTTLGEALAQLGAPLYLWEWKGDGAALAWGWSDSGHWGIALSVPVSDAGSASFSMDDIAKDMPGAVLFFGPDDVLVEAREGKLSEIRAETSRKRPAPPPEEAP